MKLSILLLLSFTLSVALVSAQVTSPAPGIARFADRSLHAIHGLPSNLVVSDVNSNITADCASFSNRGGLVSQNGVVRLLHADLSVGGEYTTGEVAPVLNIDNSFETAIAYLPSKHALLRWTGSAFSLTEVADLSLDGNVSSIRLTSPTTVRMLVLHGDFSVSAVTLSLSSGSVTSSDFLPGVHGHAFSQLSYVVSEYPHGLVIESADGYSRELSLSASPLPPDDLTIERMSSDWLHIASASTGEDWALYLNNTHLLLSILPQPPTHKMNAELFSRQAEVSK